MRGKVKCSGSNSERRKPELSENDWPCRTLMHRECISESLIPTNTVPLSNIISSGQSLNVGTISIYTTVRGQKGSSDALFAPKMDIFKQAILNTANIQTLEIFPPARESLSIQTSISRSGRNQSRLHGSWLHQLV